MTAEDLRRWRRFLEEECRRPNGLLCLYESQRSPEVDHWGGTLAQHLAAFLSGVELPGEAMAGEVSPPPGREGEDSLGHRGG